MGNNRYSALKGRELARKVREDLARSGVIIEMVRKDSRWPDAYKAEQLEKQSAEARAIVAEGRAAMAAWSRAAQADARRRMVPDLGSPAEESRRVANELRLGRLIQQNKDNAKQAAPELAAKADQAYRLGNLNEASVLAQAAIELGGASAPRLAMEVATLVEYDEVTADPTRAKARQDLAQVDITAAVFARDLAAEASRVLQDQARMAQALGDTNATSKATSEAAHQSIASKVLAAQLANVTGTAYKEPVGAMHSGPLDGKLDDPDSTPEQMLAPGEKPWPTLL